MRSAYNESWLHHLDIIKEAKHWLKAGMIRAKQFQAISAAYPVGFYHPNFIIRILLFIASLIALSGVTGILSLIILPLLDGRGGEIIISLASIVYGVISFIVVEKTFISNSKHYKSGVNEALIYHASGFTIAGIGGLVDFNLHVLLLACLFIFSFAAVRYLDLFLTAASVLTLAGVLFFECYEMGGVWKQIIPFIFLVVFTPIYFFIRNMKLTKGFSPWTNNLLVAETLSLLLIYLSGNYMVVRELSIDLMGLSIEPGDDIPFAWIFYSLTIIIPALYIYHGITKKDVVLLRVSVIVIAFTGFTFNHYYGFEAYEMALIVAGAALIIISVLLLRYLKTIRSGFTSEMVGSESWASANLEAFIISQTAGGNQMPNQNVHGGGGEFGGGGASGEF